MEPETAPVETADSPETQPVSGDTRIEASHTPEPQEDLDALLTKLQAHADKIPAEKLQFLDRKFQPAYTRRLNLLNKNVGAAAERMLAEAEVKLPEGKTAMDLLSEGNGSEFFKVFTEATERKIKPLLDVAQQQQIDRAITSYSQLAQEEFPVVKEYAKEIGPIIANDPDLQTLASTNGWAGLPYVMQGIAYKIKSEKLEAELGKLKKLVEASTTATRTGKTTSRAGGNSPSGERAGKMTLDKALEEAVKRVATGVA